MLSEVVAIMKPGLKISVIKRPTKIVHKLCKDSANTLRLMGNVLDTLQLLCCDCKISMTNCMCGKTRAIIKHPDTDKFPIHIIQAQDNIRKHVDCLYFYHSRCKAIYY